jgi:hypothetical protein
VFVGEVSPPQSTIVSEGTVNVGATSSKRSISCIAVDEFPQSSETIHVLSIVSCVGHPFGKTRSENETVMKEQLSKVSVTSPVVDGKLSWSHEIVVIGGTVKVGGTVSIR